MPALLWRRGNVREWLKAGFRFAFHVNWQATAINEMHLRFSKAGLFRFQTFALLPRVTAMVKVCSTPARPEMTHESPGRRWAGVGQSAREKPRGCCGTSGRAVCYGDLTDAGRPVASIVGQALSETAGPAAKPEMDTCGAVCWGHRAHDPDHADVAAAARPRPGVRKTDKTDVRSDGESCSTPLCPGGAQMEAHARQCFHRSSLCAAVRANEGW